MTALVSCIQTFSIKLSKGMQDLLSLTTPSPAQLSCGNSLLLSYVTAILFRLCDSGEINFYPPPTRAPGQAWQCHMLHKDLTSAVGKETPSSSGILTHWDHEIMEHPVANLSPCREGLSENKVHPIATNGEHL